MWVLGREAQSEDPGPSDGELSQPETNSLPDLHGSVREDNPFTETLSPAGLTAVTQDLTVLSMAATELQRRLAATYQLSVFNISSPLSSQDRAVDITFVGPRGRRRLSPDCSVPVPLSQLRPLTWRHGRVGGAP